MKLKKTIATLLALSLVVVNTMSASAFSAGNKERSFTHDGKSGTVNVTADVASSYGVTGYRYIGEMSYGKKANLKVNVVGYYYNDRGVLCVYSDEGIAYNAKNVSTSYSYISRCSSAVCDKNHKCNASAFINGVQVKTVYFP